MGAATAFAWHSRPRRGSRVKRRRAGARPRILQRLWLELQDSAHPTPIAKLAQARRDVEADPRMYARGEHRLAVAITHQLGARSLVATIRLDDLMDIADPERIHCEEMAVVAMSLDEFLDLVALKASEHEAA